MPSLAPPVHVMSLNLLYHTTVILLHRPVILGARDMSAPGPYRAYQTCISATGAIHDLLMLQANTFGLSHVSYLNAYSAYIAATIAVLRFEREHNPIDDPTASLKRCGLTFLLEVLSRTAAAMPALERSHAIIRKRMQAVLDRQPRRLSQPPPVTTQPFSMPTTHEMSLAQPTAFQAISNSAMSQPFNTQNGFVSPIPWQSDMRSSLYHDATQGGHLMEDFLPAFPGQQFPVGSEHSFGSEVDTQARTALLGYSLDPHPRLNAGDIDWGLMDGFHGSGQVSAM
jgi:hypothetical protein